MLPGWLVLAVVSLASTLAHEGFAKSMPSGRLQSHQLKSNSSAVQLQVQLDSQRQKLISRSRHVSLQDAVEQTLLNNPNLAESYSQIQQQQWNLIAVRRQWYPSLSAGAVGVNLFGYRGITTNLVNSDALGFSPRTGFRNLVETSPQMRLSWTFFDPSRGASINAASESVRAQRLLFDVSARNVVLETQSAYFSLQEQMQLVADYEAILDTTNQMVATTEAQFVSGYASLADVEQIRTQQFQTLTTLIDTYRRLVDAAARLAQAMALPTGVLSIPKERLTPLGQWTSSEAETLRQAEQMREEIQASLAKASSQGWQAVSLFYNYWPRFSTNASGTLLNANSSANSGASNQISSTTVNSEDSVWTGAVGLGFTWSIFDGGINAAQAEQRKATAKQFYDQAAVIRLSVAREVERSYANYQASAMALVSTKYQLQSAQNAAAIIRERFRIGFSDMTAVVQTYRQSIQASGAYAQAIREFNLAIAELYRYSASWPDGALPLLQRRVDSLK